jgi:hypothetical protein
LRKITFQFQVLICGYRSEFDLLLPLIDPLKVKIMSLKSSSDSKFKQGQKKGTPQGRDYHQQEVYDIVNKVRSVRLLLSQLPQNNKSYPEVTYGVDFGEEVENNPIENRQEAEEAPAEEDLDNTESVTEPFSDDHHGEVVERNESRESTEDPGELQNQEELEEESEYDEGEDEPGDDWGAGSIEDLSQDLTALNTSDEHRVSSGSYVSSAPPPRDEVLSMLQERTLQALQYQLFDRLNNGDYEEVWPLCLCLCPSLSLLILSHEPLAVNST